MQCSMVLWEALKDVQQVEAEESPTARLEKTAQASAMPQTSCVSQNSRIPES